MSSPRPSKLIGSKCNYGNGVTPPPIQFKLNPANWLKTKIWRSNVDYPLSSKSLFVYYLIIDYHFDLLCLTETWSQQEDYVSLNEMAAHTDTYYHISRGTA